MSDENGDDHIPLTKAVRGQLRAEIRRTGVTAIMLFDDANDMPAGLTPGILNRWMNGLLRTAPRAHFDYVMRRWSALPPLEAGTFKRGKRYPANADAYIEVTDVMAAQLRAELARTGIGHATLLDGLGDVPRGLTARIINGWLYRHAATTKSAHWTFVMDFLATRPDQLG